MRRDNEPPYSHDDRHEDDPVYTSSRREAIVAFLGWLGFGVVTIVVSYALGYDVDPDGLSTVLGMPSWVFWGVVAPWIGAIAFGVWFSLRFVTDEDLGGEPDEESRDG